MDVSARKRGWHGNPQYVRSVSDEFTGSNRICHSPSCFDIQICRAPLVTPGVDLAVIMVYALDAGDVWPYQLERYKTH